MASKLVIIVLALALTASLAGAAIYYTQTNPSQEPSGSERFQVLIVTSANMEPTIMEGNKILVDKQISPRDLRDNYPNSDIIVYYKTSERNELIVSRIVAVEEVNGKLVFYTKGDANGANKYPDTPSRSEYDPWTITEDLILGRVIDTDFK